MKFVAEVTDNLDVVTKEYVDTLYSTFVQKLISNESQTNYIGAMIDIWTEGVYSRILNLFRPFCNLYTFNQKLGNIFGNP